MVIVSLPISCMKFYTYLVSYCIIRYFRQESIQVRAIEHITSYGIFFESISSTTLLNIVPSRSLNLSATQT